MEKNIHAFLKFLNVIFCITLFIFWLFYTKQKSMFYGEIKGLYDPVIGNLYEILLVIFAFTFLPILGATFFRFKRSQIAFLGLTIVNLFLIFTIIYLFAWV